MYRSVDPIRLVQAGLCCLVVMHALAVASEAVTTGQLVTAIADQLVSKQIKTGLSAGTWPKESEFTGSIVAGMAGAYRLTGDSSYRLAAEQGADYSLVASGGNYYGDEAYGMCRLSEACEDPVLNAWRGAVEIFYQRVKNSPGRTQGYVAQFATVDPGDAAFYLANHVVAAFYVDAVDKLLWRDALVDCLSRISDTSCTSPIAGIAGATWALAISGPLDQTRIDRSGKAAAYWKGRTLAELPAILRSHQVPAGEDYAGSFYARIDHDVIVAGSPKSGYTEDLIFGIMAFSAIAEVRHDVAVESALAAARGALLSQMPLDGNIPMHLWLPSAEHHVYAGEVLLALDAAVIPGDASLDGDVDMDDFTRIARHWRSSVTRSSCDRRLADWTGDDIVGFEDLVVLADRWLSR